MKRREVITLLGCAAATPMFGPLATRAQQPARVRKIGVLMVGAKTDPYAQSNLAVFRQELQKGGWAVGGNVRIEDRWAAGDTPSIPPYAAELAALNPDVILVSGPGGLAALQQTTRTIPIVFVSVSDPVGQGFVASFPRPGGNITGFTAFDFSRIGKLLEMLKEIAPHITRFALVFSPNNPNAADYVKSLEAAALALAVKASPVPVRNAAEIEQAVDAVAREPNGGLVIPPNYITSVHRELIFSLSTRYRLPSIYPERNYATGGGLMAYGPDRDDLYRRAASYVDRILKGENPGELPVQQPTKFELVVNLKTAKALGLTIPESFLLRADEVIE
jgi:putative ABC transport system substrate-binding protein